jgi:beta-xylosidase
VERTPDDWAMLYSSFDGQGYGMAISENGVHWERVQQSPMLARAEIALNPWYPELVYHDGVYFFYIEADTFDGGTNIYVSTYEGSLR